MCLILLSSNKTKTEEETDEVISRVLDEIGIKMNEDLMAAPSVSLSSSAEPEKAKVAVAAGPSAPSEDDDLMARLNALKK